MVPPPKPPPSPVAVAGPEMLPVTLEKPSKLEPVLTNAPERPLDPNAPPAGVAVDLATTPPPRESPADDAHSFHEYNAARATQTVAPEFSAPDATDNQGVAVATATTEVHLPTSAPSVGSEQPVVVTPASPLESAPDTGASSTPGAVRTEAQSDQAAGVNAAEPANAASVTAATPEATAATLQHHVETAEQTQQINAVLLEINKLLFEIGDANIAFSTLAAKANGALPLGAELRRQVLEGIRKDFDTRGKRGGIDLFNTHKTSEVKTAMQKIDSIFPPDAVFDPKQSAFVEFLREDKAMLQQALPEKYDADELIAKVEAGDMSFAETFQILFSQDNEATSAFRRNLAQALTGLRAIPDFSYQGILHSAGQEASDRNVDQLKAAFKPPEKVSWMKRSVTFGGLALVLLMALAPMMSEGQSQGGGHGG